MVDISALRRIRNARFFQNWDEFLDSDRVKESEESVRRLVDDLITLGSEQTEEAARQAVGACVRRFNDLDDGWICTIEREDIYEQLGRVVELCGFDYDEEWISEREW